jgi:hypothetical protein
MLYGTVRSGQRVAALCSTSSRVIVMAGKVTPPHRAAVPLCRRSVAQPGPASAGWGMLDMVVRPLRWREWRMAIAGSTGRSEL